MIILWLQETLSRFFKKNPTYFKVWLIILGTLVAITGIPQLLNMLPFKLNIPDLMSAKLTIAVAWASRGAIIMTFLTTKSTPVGVTDSGTVIKTTDAKALPFTATAEQISADKKAVASVEVKTVEIPVTPVQ